MQIWPFATWYGTHKVVVDRLTDFMGLRVRLQEGMSEHTSAINERPLPRRPRRSAPVDYEEPDASGNAGIDSSADEDVTDDDVDVEDTADSEYDEDFKDINVKHKAMARSSSRKKRYCADDQARVSNGANRSVTPVNVIDGIQLHMGPPGSATGYKHVSVTNNRFMLRVPMPVAAGAKRERVVLGMFDTAVEAAKHYVLWLQDPIGATEALKAGDAERMRQAEELVEQRGLVREAEGVRLFLSPFTRSGYRYVNVDPSDQGKPFNTSIDVHLGESRPVSVSLGHYRTAVQAALAVARYAREHCSAEWIREREATYPIRLKQAQRDSDGHLGFERPAPMYWREKRRLAAAAATSTRIAVQPASTSPAMAPPIATRAMPSAPTGTGELTTAASDAVPAPRPVCLPHRGVSDRPPPGSVRSKHPMVCHAEPRVEPARGKSLTQRAVGGAAPCAAAPVTARPLPEKAPPIPTVPRAPPALAPPACEAATGNAAHATAEKAAAPTPLATAASAALGALAAATTSLSTVNSGKELSATAWADASSTAREEAPAASEAAKADTASKNASKVADETALLASASIKAGVLEAKRVSEANARRKMEANVSSHPLMMYTLVHA